MRNLCKCPICHHTIDVHDEPFKKVFEDYNLHCIKHSKGCHAVLSDPSIKENSPYWAECDCKKIFR